MRPGKKGLLTDSFGEAEPRAAVCGWGTRTLPGAVKGRVGLGIP